MINKNVQISPLLSIIVPVHNSQNTIETCLNSISKSTYHNIEIILIDNGSTDDTRKKINKLMEIDNRIIYKKIDVSDVSIARNLGIDISTGDYVTFVDSDDLIERKAYEILMNILSSNSDVDILAFDYKTIIDKKNSVINNQHNKINLTKKAKKYSKNEAILQLFYIHSIDGYVWNKIYKKSIINNTRFESYKYSEDIKFNYDLLIKNANVSVSFVKSKLYYYIQNETQTSNKMTYEKCLSGIKAYKKMINYDTSKQLLFLINNRIFALAFKAFKNVYNHNYTNELANIKGIMTECRSLTKLSLKNKIKFFCTNFILRQTKEKNTR